MPIVLLLLAEKADRDAQAKLADHGHPGIDLALSIASGLTGKIPGS
ncbi:hypothetical protein ACU8L2_23600 [Rhizobium leguminosarum]